jgi:DnaK suppressor protein
MAVSMKRRQDRLKRMLLERSRELETRLRKEVTTRVRHAPNSASASARDEGDLSLVEHEQDINCRRINACSQSLNHISEALARLKQATYGVCEECGTEISERRLQVMPFTQYCLECQEVLEDARMAQRISEWLDRKNPARDQ